MGANKGKNDFDFTFFMTVFIMLTFGVVMVLSASTAIAYRDTGDSLYVFKRQLGWTAVGIVFMFIASKMDYRILSSKLANMMLAATFGLLVAVLLFGTEVNGAKRWFMGFQPSEFAKISLIIFFAHYLSKGSNKLKKFGGLLFPYLTIIVAIAGLLMLQPHFSATLLISSTLVVMLFVAGAKIWHFLLLAAPAFAVGTYLIFSSEYRADRITAFLDPFKYARDEGFQIVQSLYAIGSGGPFGMGLGRSRQKALYLPEPHNDFIFSVVCEELGFIGAALLIILFIFLIRRGMQIAVNAPDTFGTYLGVGIMTLIGVQAFVNIAVVTSSMPVTGMPLPLFSYGGSAMIFTMSALGIMLNISKQSKTLQRR